MNKESYILQNDFNDRLNGYLGCSDDYYYTRVNGGQIGLDIWEVLTYRIG